MICSTIRATNASFRRTQCDIRNGIVIYLGGEPMSGCHYTSTIERG